MPDALRNFGLLKAFFQVTGNWGASCPLPTEINMRIAIAAAIFAASMSFAMADFYVVQNMQTGQCAIEQELPSSAETQILLNNIFMERADAEAALKDVPACN